jgi:hypothetical protein
MGLAIAAQTFEMDGVRHSPNREGLDRVARLVR